MGFLNQLFSGEQLEALDDKERQILRDAILKQIQTSPEIRDILNKMQRTEPDSKGS
jgi:hypothetical protein